MVGDTSIPPVGLRGRGSNDGVDGAANRGPDTSFDLALYWRLALKHRLLIIVCVVMAALIGVAATLLMTPIYTASTTIQIDREAARILNVDDVAPQESMIQGEEFFQTQHGILRSRSLAERVVDSLGLASSDAFLEQMKVKVPEASGSAAERTRARREAVLKTIADNLSVSPVRGSRLVVVSFDSPDPQLSTRIVNAIAENFIASNLDRKFESSSYAREFLEQRIAQTRTRLEEAERQLVAYASAQQIINVAEPGQDANEAAQSLDTNNLVALNTALASARTARIAAEEKWRQARNAPVGALPEVNQNQAYQLLTQERAKLEAQYEQGLAVYQPEFPQMQQLRAQIQELTSQQATIANGIRSSIQGQYTVALNAENSLRRQVDALKGEVLDLRERSIQYNIIQREVDTSRTLYDGLLQRYKEVGVTGGVAANNIFVIDRADPPQKPSKPRLIFNLAIALVLGLGLGVLAAFIIEALDETLATPEDVESKLGLPVLGAVPLLTKGERPSEVLGDIRSPFSEAYYSLRTALQFSTAHGAPRSLLVTSSRPAEGKSTTAYAIALNLARVGKKVLLADGDLRNPSMHRLMDVSNDRGMSNLLSGDGTLDSLVKPTSQANLSFIPCGPLPPNPAELWGGDQIVNVLAQAAEQFDHVVIDGPPVLGFADGPLLSSAVEGTVFVLESRGTRRAQARGAIKRLLIGRGHLLGVVLTKFNAKSIQYGGYDYAYDYNYGPQSAAKPSRKR